ncbi:uncharacterized protein Z518_08491 [Rhinocladiella mackenziei CBS 650.93]|uniref:Uncharacterized protein n=1 Tax=Rhinocladiella mackenziei CBS 650.93 TaxID=1442369 RepID=A0A0D2J118_9EURO|nr:uncharacterized protein Z518_08491 [Rhinocladiella mackenziei CBS 650.93]KIX02550.1 hypothetical protein Z518_08491 [Rhinocladiella mackenziei CBS 650.93]
MSSSSDASEGGYFDVIIIGAGISGINAAYRLQTQLPNYHYVILEGRRNIGGTWDLFRYPGIRSDSDLFTFGFPWNPWKKQNPIADGESIRKYLEESASLHRIDGHILFNHYLSLASWSSTDRLWTLTTHSNGVKKLFSARFVVFGTGYYDYQKPLDAVIPEIEHFRGQVIHPQFWPEDLDYTNHQVVIIGSGATAVTLLPAMTPKASRVTMLQRSPTYIFSVPNRDSTRSRIGHLVPETWYPKLKRLAWVIRSYLFVFFCRRYPNAAKKLMAKSVIKQLPATIPFDPHFKPRYSPWDQRLCFCPDGDFFKALSTGKAFVETGVIREVVSDGIVLASGTKLDADIIVTATGLKLQFGGGVKIEVDGASLAISDKFIWNGVMLQDVPNASFVMGYTDASWTLGADTAAHFICRLLKYLDRHQFSAAVPCVPSSAVLVDTPVLNLNSTYVRLGAKNLPRAATQAPWTGRKTYFQDMAWAKFGRLDQGLKFMGCASS